MTLSATEDVGISCGADADVAATGDSSDLATFTSAGAVVSAGAAADAGTLVSDTTAGLGLGEAADVAAVVASGLDSRLVGATASLPSAAESPDEAADFKVVVI